MLVYISGAAAYGWACIGLARLLRVARTAPGTTVREPGWGQRAAPARWRCSPCFIFVPTWFTHRMITINSIRYDAALPGAAA